MRSILVKYFGFYVNLEPDIPIWRSIRFHLAPIFFGQNHILCGFGQLTFGALFQVVRSATT